MSLVCVLYDDARAASWYPFTLTRPAGELLFGAYTARERVEAALGIRCIGHLAADRLAGFDEYGCAPVLTRASVPQNAARLFLNSRFLPDWSAGFTEPRGAVAIVAGDRTAGWYAPAGVAAPDPAGLGPDSGRDGAEMPGTFLEDVWDLVDGNPAQLAADLSRGPASDAAPLPAHVHRIGPAADVRAAPDVVVEPDVVIDVTEGPVLLDAGVRVRAFTRLAGPAYIGRETTLLGGSISGVSIGAHCKVRGEIEASVMLGYANKAHDGFLGHAYVGRWVNLGALTTNSDLKNNYRPVRVRMPEGERDTGRIKIGCFLGDHVRTAIGTLLNTGTVVGPGATLFGRAMPPKLVAPLDWGGGGETRYELDRFLETAATVMARRGVVLSDGMRRVFTALRDSLP
ncbi:MAG: putative sugar nucleotidyl transferase [Gemmatimonadota bacterium]|jgi:UDP-N-acetylglucosamine diphosphorylase/glucosamine-1-phosphate N-acetyltransferase